MNDTLAAIQNFLGKRLDIPVEKITVDTTLESLEIDSLMLLELMFELEEQLNIRLSNDTPTPKTIGELIEIIRQVRAQNPTAAL